MLSLISVMIDTADIGTILPWNFSLLTKEISAIAWGRQVTLWQPRHTLAIWRNIFATSASQNHSSTHSPNHVLKPVLNRFNSLLLNFWVEMLGQGVFGFFGLRVESELAMMKLGWFKVWLCQDEFGMKWLSTIKPQTIGKPLGLCLTTHRGDALVRTGLVGGPSR